MLAEVGSDADVEARVGRLRDQLDGPEPEEWLADAVPAAMQKAAAAATEHEAANGPKQTSAPVEKPVGHFRRCLEADYGKADLASLLKRLPRSGWSKSPPPNGAPVSVALREVEP